MLRDLPDTQAETDRHIELLRSALRSTEVGVWEMDPDTGDSVWADGMAELLCVPPERAAEESKRWMEYVHPEDRARVAAELAQAKPGATWSTEFRVIRADGAVRWIASRAIVIANVEGKRRLVGSDHDITARKEAQERLALALKAGQAGTFDWDAATNTRLWSDEQLALYGMRREEFHGRHEDWLNCVLPEDREPAARALKRALETGDYSADFRIRRRDNGEIRWLHGRGRVFFDSQHRPVRIIGINVDITARVRAEESAREWRYADSRKTEFLALLAHELRNPLGAIRNGVELLRSGSEPVLREVRSMIGRQVEHMTRVIEDLFDVGLISQGKLALRVQRSSLTDIIRQSIDMVTPHVGHEFVVSLPSEPMYFNADPVRLVQVFTNLLNNACKYTGKGGRISLVARQEGSDVVVSVKDTGIGISPAHLSHVFEMFWRDPTGDKAAGGLGLGLALSRALVQMHGGSIEARSEGPGKGSEFIVRLPALAQRAAKRVPTAQPLPAPASKAAARRVLVVDDNLDVAESLAMLLRLDGNEVHTAHDGTEAIEKAAESRPEIVLLDLGLPTMNGYDVCRAMRQQPWGKDITIVAVSGWGQEEDKRKSREAGFNAHLLKPVEPSALQDLLATTPADRPRARGGGWLKRGQLRRYANTTERNTAPDDAQ